MATTQDATGGSPRNQRSFASEAHVEEVLGAKPLNGYFTSLMHLCKCYVGSGIFAMGDAYKNSGLIVGSVMLILIGLINLNCQHILIKVCKKIADREQEEERIVKPTFAETVQYTMEDSHLKCLRKHSKKFNIITNVFLCICELGFCCVYFIFIAEHLIKIAKYYDLMENNGSNKNIMLAIILLPMWLSTFLGSLELLLPLSILANILIWIGIGIIFFFTTHDGLVSASERNMVAPIQRLPMFFGITLFAFEGITFIIPLRNEMKNSHHFTMVAGVLNVGMIFVLILYFSVGILSYWKYGEDIQASVFLNLDEEDQTTAIVVYIVMCIGILCTFTLHMYIPFEILFPLFYRKYGPFKHPILVMIVFRSIPVLVTWLLANIIPFLGLFIGLVGATAGAFLALIMPACLELIAFQGENSIVTMMKDGFIIVLGVLGLISGTVITLLDLVHEFQKIHGNANGHANVTNSTA